MVAPRQQVIPVSLRAEIAQYVTRLVDAEPSHCPDSYYQTAIYAETHADPEVLEVAIVLVHEPITPTAAVEEDRLEFALREGSFEDVRISHTFEEEEAVDPPTSWSEVRGIIEEFVVDHWRSENPPAIRPGSRRTHE